MSSLDLNFFGEATARSLARELFHPPPFTEEELQRVENLSLYYHHTPDLLQRTPNVALLGLYGCNFSSLQFVFEFPLMRSLSIWGSKVKSLVALTDHEKVRRLDFRACPIVDITPLLSMKSLGSLEIKGLPLSEESYFKVLPQLESRLRRIRYDDEVVWRVNCRLHSMGLDMAYARNTEGRGYVRAIGTDTTPEPDGKGVRPLSMDRLEALLERDDVNEQMILDHANAYLDECVARGE